MFGTSMVRSSGVKVNLYFFFSEAKRQEFERRRKEMEEARKQKRTKGDGPPRKRKKKNQPEGQVQGQLPLQSHPLGIDPTATGDKGQQIDMGVSPEKVVKKRMRKTKKEKLQAEEGNFDGAFDLFMQQLKQLPPVPLMEPLVSHMYAICSLPGMSATTNSKFSFDILYITILCQGTC